MSEVLCEKYSRSDVGSPQNGEIEQSPETDTKDLQIKETEKQPLYLPQPGDEFPTKPEGPMGPIGPWATGQPISTPQGGTTGLRPVSDRYSITRYNPSDWRSRNAFILKESESKIIEARLASNAAKQCVQKMYKETDRTQLETTEHLKDRANLVFRWKSELENAIKNINEEIELLENERRRVKQSLSVLTIPESICGEFLQLRGLRMESDLVRDNVEDELTKEVALCSEVRNLFLQTRERIETQLTELKTAKSRMEYDWTDKIHAYEVDTISAKLTNDSGVIMWKPGTTRFPAEQSTPGSYEHFTKEVLAAAENVRNNSVNLRSTLDAIYTNSIKDLRDQSSSVDVALEEKIRLTEEACLALEKELVKCLRELASVETLIEKLRDSTKGLNNAMKVAQTRLDNRLLRRNVESCRDIPQFALVDEVKSIAERVSAMLGELKKAEETQASLVKARGDLEREITVKRKTLYIDKQRGQLLRSFYPSAAALSGFQ